MHFLQTLDYPNSGFKTSKPYPLHGFQSIAVWPLLALQKLRLLRGIREEGALLKIYTTVFGGE